MRLSLGRRLVFLIVMTEESGSAIGEAAAAIVLAIVFACAFSGKE
jgi:hypothetical protein